MERGRLISQPPGRPPLARQLLLMLMLLLLLLPPRASPPLLRPALAGSSVEHSRPMPVFAQQHRLVQPGLDQLSAFLASRINGRGARGNSHRHRKPLPWGGIDVGFWRAGDAAARDCDTAAAVHGGDGSSRRIHEPTRPAASFRYEPFLLSFLLSSGG